MFASLSVENSNCSKNPHLNAVLSKSTTKPRSSAANANSPFSNRISLSSYEKGIFAESCAEKELITQGYTILGKRVRTPYGEIDILASKDRDLVAVEVKERKYLSIARSAISLRQQRRIVNALLYVVSTREEIFENYRVDVICLDSVGRFEHIENAFSIEDLIAS